MVNKKDLIYSTFIGLSVKIINSSQRKTIGLQGTIVDETKNTLSIETEDGKEVKIPKISSVFLFKTDYDEEVEVEGSKIAFRPHERAKKV